MTDNQSDICCLHPLDQFSFTERRTEKTERQKLEAVMKIKNTKSLSPNDENDIISFFQSVTDGGSSETGFFGLLEYYQPDPYRGNL